MPPPSQPDMYTPTPSKLAIATGLLIVLSSLTHLSNGKLDRRGLRDLKDYFVGRGLEASRWEVPREDTTCVRRSWEKSHEEGEWTEGELSSLSVCMGVGEMLMMYGKGGQIRIHSWRRKVVQFIHYLMRD